MRIRKVFIDAMMTLWDSLEKYLYAHVYPVYKAQWFSITAV